MRFSVEDGDCPTDNCTIPDTVSFTVFLNFFQLELLLSEEGDFGAAIPVFGSTARRTPPVDADDIESL